MLLATLAASPRQARAGGHAERGLILPPSVWELGLGLGLAREDAPDALGFGLNFELGGALTSRLELRLRSGVAFSREGRLTRADIYGRPFETETYNRGGDTLANPEIGLRWVLVRLTAVELGLDTRATLPVGSPFGLLIGLPVNLYFGGRVKLETGIFVPIVFYDDVWTIVSIPLHLWINLDSGLYLGPLTGVRFRDGGGTDVPLGFGLGTSLASDADLRLWILFPDVSESGGAKDFGAGVAVYVSF
jgi:hypothetical protein